MSTTTKPSEGAVRAANAINMCEGDIYYEDDIETWAEIIDRETHAGEMLEALEEISQKDPCPSDSPEQCDYRRDGRCIGCIARAAIRRARGGE